MNTKNKSGIKTDNKWREILTWHDLTEKERAEFEWADQDAQFVRYKGRVYCLDEFAIASTSDNFKGWDGYVGDSFFSGVVIKISSDGERAKMGTYMC